MMLSRLRFLLPLALAARAAAADSAALFEKEVRPILEEHCYDCHGDGEKKNA